MGTSFYHRYNVPVGAVVDVQVQARVNFTAMQTSGYGRYIGGLRSHAKINFYLQDVVVGRV